MKLVFHLILLNFYSLSINCDKLKIFQLESRNFSIYSDAVVEIITEMFSHDVTTTNLISPESLKALDLNDFKDELLKRTSATSQIVVRQDSTMKQISIHGRRKRFSIILIKTFDGFLQAINKMTPKYFWFNGFFLILLANGDFPEVENIFRHLWQKQIYNVNIMVESADGSIFFKTFIPFNLEKCNDTTPILINTFKDGKFVNANENLFPAKMENLQSCPIRVATSKDSRPFVYAEKLKNGTFRLSGRDVDLVEALSKSLKFQVNYSFVGELGYIYENGSSVGALKAVLDNEADLSVADWWLKGHRLNFFDSTNAYICDPIIFIIPPGRDLTPFEKLIYPFSVNVWILIVISFFIGFLVILILKRQSMKLQKFVFGMNVKNPYMNMFISFIGGTQKVLPRTNFARFLLMMFLMYSLVIRTLYQGSFYKLMQSIECHKEVQSVEEMVDKDFKVHVLQTAVDVLQESEALKSRFE